MFFVGDTNTKLLFDFNRKVITAAQLPLLDNNGILISNIDILCGILVFLPWRDYDAITTKRDDDYFKDYLGITNVPSAERLRQRFSEEADG